MSLRVHVLSASARTGSHNTALAALAARRIEAAGAHVRSTNIRDFEVPLYDGDVQAERGVPDGARRLAGMLASYDATVIVSPEYNYSMPGNLKNLIDWVSRIKPWPTIGVQALLMSASPGPVGGHRGLIALRVPLEGLGARLHSDMFWLAGADRAFAADGGLADPGQDARLSGVIGGFLDVVAAVKDYRGRGAAAAA